MLGEGSMRSDYTLYTVAIILFIVTIIALVQQIGELWIISTFILGLFFIGLGYSQRPKAQAVAKTVHVEAPPLPTPAVQETVEKPAPTMIDLTEVKGIGEKRAAQLKNIGINSVEDLAKASAEDLASKLKVSPKITGAWIENAKKLTEKS
jgi:predicted flap endonuclease-1-like 5' DNA nuclease